jgi:YspA, cpYpsA-related SLOG family
MTVLVCGGRDFDDEDGLFSALDALHYGKKITRLVHGAAKGADTLGARWALGKGIFSAGYPAQWDKYGKKAGVVRNQEMLDREEIEFVVACPGGRGTADMVRRATAAGIPVIHV